jgi:hypothetical protein
MRYLFFIALLSLTCSCTDFLPKNRQISNEEMVVNRALKKAATEIQSRYGLTPCGFGGGSNEGVWMLALSFDYYHEANEEEARKLLLSAIDHFLKVINTEEGVRPFLKRYPFKPDNLEVRIFFYKPDGSILSPGKLTVLSFYDGALHYRANDEKDVLLKTRKTETYEEAMNLSNHQSSDKAS